MKQFKEYLEQQLNNYRECIIERAKFYLEDCNNLEWEEIEKKYDLYDLDMDKYPINLYDSEDMSNHSFDLGGYYAIKNMITELENFKPMELLKPRICEMAENKTIEYLSGLEGYVGLNLFNEDETMKEEYQSLYNKHYDQIYNYLNVFEI